MKRAEFEIYYPLSVSEKLLHWANREGEMTDSDLTEFKCVAKVAAESLEGFYSKLNQPKENENDASSSS